MSKKILLIISILLIVGIAIFFILNSKPLPEEGESRVGFSIRDYLPFGRSGEGENDQDGKTASSTDIANGQPNQFGGNLFDDGTNTKNLPIPRLRKISNEPVAGAIIFNTGTTSIVRFVEKGTGNVYEAKSNSLTINRLTNTTIRKIIRAFWLFNGSGFLAQTLIPESEIIETNFVKLSAQKATNTENLTPFDTTISQLPTGIKEITVKPDNSKIFYYTVSNSSEWYTANPDGTKSVQVASHPLTEWLPKWTSNNTIIMQTKGSSDGPAYLYTFDTEKLILKKIGTGSLGLTSNPSPDGSLSLVSSGRTLPELFLINNKTASSTKVYTKTLAEKCVWLKNKNPIVICAVPDGLTRGNFPDIWYKGLITTQDSIKKIDINNDIQYNVADLAEISKEKIDVSDIMLSPDESYLIFRNKIDGYLWLLRVVE